MCDRGKDTEGETKREQCYKVKLSFFLNNACGHASILEKEIFEDVQHKYIFFLSTCFSPKRVFLYSWQHRVCIFSSLHIPVCIWCPPQPSLWTQCVLRERWEEMIHSSDKAQDTNPSWPADQLVDIADLPRCGCRAALIRAFSGAWWAGHHLSRGDSVWQQTQARLTSEKMCTSHHLIQMSNQIRNCRDDSMIWRLDLPVRAVIILLQLEIWILPQVCVFLFLRVNVSPQNFAEGDIYSSKLLWLLWTGNFKAQREGRWLSAAVRGAEIDTKKTCVFASPPVYMFDTDRL